MKRLFCLLTGVVVSGNFLFAQSVEQGKKYFYYERYKSAKETFEKVLAANPNDLDAVYWMGQTLFELEDSVSAKALYAKALQQNGNAPLILAGMGQAELMEGKVDDARQRFELALSVSKNKDVDVFNAVGNANIQARMGDANYAIEKLLQATQVKRFKDPNTFVLLGNAYRKLIDGGSAVVSYNRALTMDANLAVAKYNIGRVYLTQKNQDYYLPAFEEAVTMDPNFAPAWYQLYYHYYFRDINKAADYFDKYLAVSDPSPSNEYDRISIIYGRKLYPEAIAAAQEKIRSEGAATDPRYYKLIAYSYDESGDSTNAKSFMEQYFGKQKPEGFVPKDYSFYAKLLARFHEYDAAFKNYQNAIDADTAMDVKLDLMKEASDLAKASGDRKAQAEWLGKLFVMKPNPNQNDYYNWGLAHYQAANYVTADSIFCGLYESKYPNEIYGYLWCARAKEAQDTTWEAGLAVQPYEKLAEMAMSIDSTKYKRQAIDSWFKLVVYHNDVKKDKETAVSFLDKILSADPTNPDAIRIRELLTRPAPAPRQPAPGKPKQGGSSKN